MLSCKASISKGDSIDEEDKSRWTTLAGSANCFQVNSGQY